MRIKKAGTVLGGPFNGHLGMGWHARASELHLGGTQWCECSEKTLVSPGPSLHKLSCSHRGQSGALRWPLCTVLSVVLYHFHWSLFNNDNSVVDSTLRFPLPPPHQRCLVPSSCASTQSASLPPEGRCKDRGFPALFCAVLSRASVTTVTHWLSPGFCCWLAFDIFPSKHIRRGKISRR
jgi:hypothetical protein